MVQGQGLSICWVLRAGYRGGILRDPQSRASQPYTSSPSTALRAVVGGGDILCAEGTHCAESWRQDQACPVGRATGASVCHRWRCGQGGGPGGGITSHKTLGQGLKHMTGRTRETR